MSPRRALRAGGGRPAPRAAALAVAALAAGALACGVWPFAEPAERISLTAGAVYPRSLAGNGPHRFRFAAAAGRFLHLAVDQRGVDVVVLLRDPAGRLLFEADSPIGSWGEETVLVVTPAAGDYLLVVEPFAAGARGAFAFMVRETRPAQPEDRLRAAAAAPWARAERRRLQGDLEGAAAAYREALPRLAAAGEPKKLAEAAWHLGQALVAAGRLRDGAAALKRAAARFRTLQDGVGEARALTDLGADLRTLGDSGQAVAAHQRALRLYGAAGNVSGTATTLNDLGLVEEATGDLQGAIGHYEAALAVWRRLGALVPQAATLQNLGSLYALIGYDAEALDLLEQARALLAGEKDPAKRIAILVALGWEQYLAGQPEQALGRYGEALALAERSGARRAEAGIWDRRGSALRALRRYQEAAASYSRALDKSRAAGSRLSEGHTLANLGWLDLETGAVPRGRERLASALRLLATCGDRNGEIYARVGLSRAARRLGDLAEARTQAEAAVGLVEQIRTSLHGPASRGQFLATRFNAYEELVNLLMDLDRRAPGRGHARAALEVAERARARNLLEEIARGGAATTAGAAAARQRLLAEMQALEERRTVLAGRDPAARGLAPLDAALRARSLELDRLAVSPDPRPALAPLTSSDIQALADERSMLLVYMLAEPASFAWTVDRGQIVPHVLPGRERIEQLARRVLTGLAQGPQLATQAAVAAAMRELSQAILAPLGARIEGRRNLVVLADGALHLVPFAALPAPPGGAGSAEEPLLVRHQVAMIPSATVLAWQRRRLADRPPAPRALAVLADPVFSPDDERLSASRRNPASPAVAPAAGRNAESPAAGPFERLPLTAEEARAIVGLLPPRTTLLALGPAASRELVVGGALRRYRILHFATHGVLDPVLPQWSGLVLSRFDDKGRRRDGFLSAPDVATLDLPAELAVLSGCQTGLGRELRGEGLVGLTQAFFRAGTRRVVVSFWKVRERATADLMARFYRHLLVEGLPPAAALRAAQLALRGGQTWRSPYFWAGFSFQGDWR